MSNPNMAAEAAIINSHFECLKDSMVDLGRGLIRMHNEIGKDRFDALFSATAAEPEYRMPRALRAALMRIALEGRDAITEDVLDLYLNHIKEVMK